MTIADTILKEIVRDLNDSLGKSGLMYRIFSRTKSAESIQKKLNKKSDEYRAKNKKMQDFMALRITMYFSDDVKIIHDFLKRQSNFVDESVDIAEIDKFCPQRLNLVMRVPDKLKKETLQAIKQTDYPELIDDTYEIQIRTILSEGWHEVEHDLRYKCQQDWNDFKESSRLLNGVYATLENSDWAMLSLFDDIAHDCYKKNKWTPMLRNKMRLKFKDDQLSGNVMSFLDNHADTAKKIFKADRRGVLCKIMESSFCLPPTYDTIIHLINRIDVNDVELKGLESPILKDELDCFFTTV